jgi:hypothetical protein
MCLFPINGPIKGKIITMIKYYIYKAEYNNNIGHNERNWDILLITIGI